MSMTVNGFGGANPKPAGTGIVKSSSVSEAAFRSKRTEKREKRHPNYNYREIQGQLLRAKKTQSASAVLVRAKSKLADLQRSVGFGQYNEKELKNAIAHAKRMLRCAQLKVKHMKEEEQELKVQGRRNSGIAQSGKAEREYLQLLQKRRRHRDAEREKIREAEMKYLEGQQNCGRDTKKNVSSGTQGVLLEVSHQAEELLEKEILQKAKDEAKEEALEDTAVLEQPAAAELSAPEPCADMPVEAAVDVLV